MTSLGNQFLTLTTSQRRAVLFSLCRHALEKWCRYAAEKDQIQYRESVCGTLQEVDKQLPVDALESAASGIDALRVNERYAEPITALQDEDVTFPEHIGYAYYAVYNLFRKYARGEEVDDWLIANQALSSEIDDRKREAFFITVIRDAETGSEAI